MRDIRFTSNTKLIERLIKTFIKTDPNADTWGTIYLCPKTNEKWQKINVETEYHGGGYPILFKLPDPRKLDLINILINSDNIDEIATSSALLVINEKELKDEFREELITELENRINQNDFNWNKFNSQKMKTIIYETQLFDKTNRKPILGKKNSEIEKDHKFYLNISERAKKIITTANNAYNL
jgi:hypothetical protein